MNRESHTMTQEVLTWSREEIFWWDSIFLFLGRFSTLAACRTEKKDLIKGNWKFPADEIQPFQFTNPRKKKSILLSFLYIDSIISYSMVQQQVNRYRQVSFSFQLLFLLNKRIERKFRCLEKHFQLNFLKLLVTAVVLRKCTEGSMWNCCESWDL